MGTKRGEGIAACKYNVNTHELSAGTPPFSERDRRGGVAVGPPWWFVRATTNMGPATTEVDPPKVRLAALRAVRRGDATIAVLAAACIQALGASGGVPALKRGREAGARQERR